MPELPPDDCEPAYGIQWGRGTTKTDVREKAMPIPRYTPEERKLVLDYILTHEHECQCPGHFIPGLPAACKGCRIELLKEELDLVRADERAALHRYDVLTIELHKLIAQGQDEGPEGEALRDESEQLYEGRPCISAKLYELVDAARADMKERAAKRCEQMCGDHLPHECAKAIRALE